MSRREEVIHGDGEFLDAADLDSLRDNAAQAAENLAMDAVGSGVISQVLANAAALMSIDVNTLVGFDRVGKHLVVSTAKAIDATTARPTLSYVWASVFATFDWEESDWRENGVNDEQYHARTEDVALSVVAGTSSNLPTNPGSGAIRLFSVKLRYTTTSVRVSGAETSTRAVIKTTGNLGGTNYMDNMDAAHEMLPLAGGTLTGPTFYEQSPSTQKLPMIFGNSGRSWMTVATKWDGSPGHADWNHVSWVSTPKIDTGIRSGRFFVIPKINLEYRRLNGSTWEWYDVDITPLTMWFGNDLSGADTITIGLVIHYGVDGSGDYDGTFVVAAYGPAAFVKRFSERRVDWTAVCPVALSGPLG